MTQQPHPNITTCLQSERTTTQRSKRSRHGQQQIKKKQREDIKRRQDVIIAHQRITRPNKTVVHMHKRMLRLPEKQGQKKRKKKKKRSRFLVPLFKLYLNTGGRSYNYNARYYRRARRGSHHVVHMHSLMFKCDEFVKLTERYELQDILKDESSANPTPTAHFYEHRAIR